MSRKDGQFAEVERHRLVWKLLVRPSVEHVAEVWWTAAGGRIANRKMEANFSTIPITQYIIQ